MSGGGDDVLIGRHFSGDLNRHVRLALVVEHHQLVFVLRLGIRVAQLDREIGRIVSADAVDRDAAGQRADETDFHLVLGVRGSRASASTAAMNPAVIIMPVLIISPSPFLIFRPRWAATATQPMVVQPKMRAS
jgi:hypothetical protein